MPLRLVRENLNSFEFLKSDPKNTIIFTDIDGTLSEIAATPEDALVTFKMKKVITDLAHLYQIVVVSGRPALEARSMVSSDKIIYLGNHGLERLDDGKLSRISSPGHDLAIDKAKEEIKRLTDGITGVRYEDKGLTFAIHYRQSNDETTTRSRILHAVEPIARQHDLKVIDGRKVVEIKIPLSDKGRAVGSIINESGRTQVVYLGDDRTDVDAFQEVKKLRSEGKLKGFALGVISVEAPDEIKTEADFCFLSVLEVEDFLEWLADVSA